MFFSYGHVYDLMRASSFFGPGVGRHRYLAPLWIILLVVGIWFLLRNSYRLALGSRNLNLVFGLLLIIPVAQIIFDCIEEELLRNQLEVSSYSQENNLFVEDGSFESLPDIYYIILDEYTRQDTLREIYDFDNTIFLDYLDSLGFYVARCSQSNYANTTLSLMSSLNLNYIEEMDIDYSEKSGSNELFSLAPYLDHSQTRLILENAGYTYIAFETGYAWADITSADYYLQPTYRSNDPSQFLLNLNEFEFLFLKTTFGRVLADATLLLPQLHLNRAHQAQRLRVNYVLDELEKMTDLPSPKFIHAHIISPHGPYVFDHRGEIPDDTSDVMLGYPGQVEYLNSRMVKILGKVLADSDVPPIIILQGDHGPRGIEVISGTSAKEHRMNILNAYYMRGEKLQDLYSSISPVNTFRLVLNEVLGKEYSLLTDIAFWSSAKSPFSFDVVPNKCENLKDHE
jgi:hypothetical protein